MDLQTILRSSRTKPSQRLNPQSHILHTDRNPHHRAGLEFVVAVSPDLVDLFTRYKFRARSSLVLLTLVIERQRQRVINKSINVLPSLFTLKDPISKKAPAPTEHPGPASLRVSGVDFYAQKLGVSELRPRHAVRNVTAVHRGASST
ncbi:hypothetical protein AKJ16_DCAP20356 [Drosera capensis]